MKSVFARQLNENIYPRPVKTVKERVETRNHQMKALSIWNKIPIHSGDRVQSSCSLFIRTSLIGYGA